MTLAGGASGVTTTVDGWADGVTTTGEGFATSFVVEHPRAATTQLAIINLRIWRLR
jgi:hypothetical protein